MLGFSFSQLFFPYTSKEPMKLKLPLAAAFVAVLSLSACGGGGGGSSSSSTAAAAADVTQLSYTDTTVGSGTQAAAGKSANVTYTGWLYSATASDHKGAQFDTGTFSFTLGSGSVIPGFDQGVTGMKVGGTRVVLIPSSLGYGATGSGPIPPNAGLVFQITLNSVQ
jgi:FKBP-type peptidyl-prolyl cis-trans isomerase FkpA